MTRPRVIVVGGGLAGLSAALRAADRGASVELYERAPRLGGATWSFTRDGISYDNGQHVFMRCCTEYRRFLERVGSAGKVILQPRMDVPVRSPSGVTSRLARIRFPAPLHLAPALARYRHLTPTERTTAVRVALALRRLRLDDPALDQQTFAGWLAERGASPRTVEALWDLVCLPTVNLRAAEASLAMAAKVFRTGLLDHADGGDLGWSAVPLQELHADAAEKALVRVGARIHTSAHVSVVGHHPTNGPTVVVDGESRTADAVVVAVPHHAIGDLMPDGAIEHQGELAQLGRSPIINVHLVFDRPVMREPFLAAVDSPVQFVFDRSEPSGAPPGQQCLAISTSGADDYLPWSRDQLVTFFVDELARLLPAARNARVVTSMVTREVAATFRATPGTASLRPGPTTRLDRVCVAGAWTDTGWPATMEGAVRSGTDAADDVLDQLAHRSERQGVAA